MAAGARITLAEAIVVCMVRGKQLTMTTEDLARLNRQYGLWCRPKDGRFPEKWQIWLRARSKGCRWLFKVHGDIETATVTLRS